MATPIKDSGCKELAKSEFGGAGEEQKPNPEQIVGAQKPVKLGKIIGNDQEILDGLSANDRIVVTGILQLQNCTAIEPVAQIPQAPEG